MNKVFDLFKQKKALLEGHFILSSGLHSDQYLQSALILNDPKIAEQLGKKLANTFKGPLAAVISPAIGALIIGHEVARAKKTKFLFTEKDAEGKPVMRRGFELKPGDRVLVIEDVITTGLSTREVVRLVKKSKAQVVGIGSLVIRSKKSKQLLQKISRRVNALIELDVQSWPQSRCHLCKAGVPAIKPGSRKK